ncbi:MAG: flagellar assembly peptidoglycan hydrolase FlgJ [Hydrogenophaga sp.]|uniref:flagellar assembly peptidoglycan hydrolase FlgJ n=2 Tax=Hydrogenophaga sp. TaxID=1904254 RepID=UPI0027315E5F|nr:flagellar assembly peptidoglycan hydrolase FlgJ [Hydrogenophaga sp.]MDP1782106.1 flagellar assembly peptidoglycan hydrolase FlgJ [Hydrogenophaga sp.]MDP2249738.1 flagellar assembly peptidoglycan hydrolase FlgJ [Hydrogenophaga sp.]MDP3352035.1 flagellar assembly peptidoglycan hydrolase FlgJ [Hydrogenophaga sp.]
MNPTSALSSNGLAADPTALNALRYGAGKGNDKAALKEAAKQFESLFMRELIKSMREATQKSGLMDGEGSDLGTDLLDQQFAVQLSGLPGGLSEAIERQLGKQMQNNAAEKAGAVNALPVSSDVSTVGRASAGPRQAGFVEQHSLAAAAVARESGIPASYMIGQAGHETGWGRSEIRHADGTPSHNLFGIKATGGWKGKVAEITTTEYINGEPRKVTAKFRAYDSYADSFRDYASLIGNSPRYDKVMDQLGSVQGFAAGLQKAGYATDPQYAAKLSRAINTTLSLQRAQG